MSYTHSVSIFGAQCCAVLWTVQQLGSQSRREEGNSVTAVHCDEGDNNTTIIIKVNSADQAPGCKHQTPILVYLSRKEIYWRENTPHRISE